MSPCVPMLRLGDTILLTLQGDLDDLSVLQVEQDLGEEVTRSRANGVLLDISGLGLVDVFIAEVLARLAAMSRLLGAEVVVVGMQPIVAMTLVELGVPMGHLTTALDTGAGLTRLRRLQLEPARQGQG